MGEIPSGAWHRREASRFARLAEFAEEPIKQKLSRMAALHERVAAEVETANAFSSVPNGRTHKVGEHGPGLYRIDFYARGDFIATQPFEADTDIAALALAYAVKEACSDLA